MHTINKSMTQNYLAHPAFQFNESVWEVDGDALSTFNMTKAAAEKMTSRLDRNSRIALKQDCLNAMRSVFASLEAQSADQYEKCFLAELEAECIRLLDEELAWYSTLGQGSILDLHAASARRKAVQLNADRHVLGQLPPAAVDEMRNIAANDVKISRSRAVEGKLKREDLSVNSGATPRNLCRVLNREFGLLGVLDAVSAYSGCRMSVSGLALELSVPQASWWKNAIQGLESPPRTLYAHLDETISNPKAIVYLSDVAEDNGPTGYYPRVYESMHLNPLQEMIGRVVGSTGTRSDSPLKEYYGKQYHQSINSLNFRRHFMRLPACLRFNSHFGWDILPGTELEGDLAGAEQKMIGPAGTFIAFDGARLAHRGGMVEHSERVALQVIFSSHKALVQTAVAKAKRMFS